MSLIIPVSQQVHIAKSSPRFRRLFALLCLITPHSGKWICGTFQNEENGITVAAFLLIMNQKDFRTLVQNWKENCNYDHILFNWKWIPNKYLWVKACFIPVPWTNYPSLVVVVVVVVVVVRWYQDKNRKEAVTRSIIIISLNNVGTSTIVNMKWRTHDWRIATWYRVLAY